MGRRLTGIGSIVMYVLGVVLLNLGRCRLLHDILVVGVISSPRLRMGRVIIVIITIVCSNVWIYGADIIIVEVAIHVDVSTAALEGIVQVAAFDDRNMSDGVAGDMVARRESIASQHSRCIAFH